MIYLGIIVLWPSRGKTLDMGLLLACFGRHHAHSCSVSWFAQYAQKWPKTSSFTLWKLVTRADPRKFILNQKFTLNGYICRKKSLHIMTCTCTSVSTHSNSCSSNQTALANLGAFNYITEMKCSVILWF